MEKKVRLAAVLTALIVVTSIVAGTESAIATTIDAAETQPLQVEEVESPTPIDAETQPVEVVSVPAEVVVDFADHGHVDHHEHGDDENAPGPSGDEAVSAERRAKEIANELRRTRHRRNRNRRGGPIGPLSHEDFGIVAAAAAGSGITVTYDPANPTPPIARPAVESGVAAWSASLETDGAPIVVDVSWLSFGNPGVLGFAGPSEFVASPTLPTGYLYPSALANVLTGSDLNGAGNPEIIVVLNSDLAGSGAWHYGNGQPGAGQHDLQSAVTHEVGHGLGFVSSASNDTGPIRLEAPPFIYDTQALYQGTPVINFANPTSILTSNNVQIKISQTQLASLHVPPTWTQGTSFSHFASTGAQVNTLMTPTLVSGQTRRVVDGFSLGVLARLGWPTSPAPVTPSITQVTVDNTTVWLGWNQLNQNPGVPADRMRIDAYKGATRVATVELSAAANAGGLSGLAPNTTYQIRLVPVRGGVDGSPSVRTVTTGSAPELGNPSPPPPFVRNKALDGQIFRVYQAHLLRVPDQNGFNFWLDQRARGLSLDDMIALFQSGPEFTNRYGSLTNAQFVLLVYRNVLGREPDPAGFNHWVAQLGAGLSRAQVMRGFVESTEYINRTSTVPPHTSAEGSIRRLYLAFFLREPPAAEAAYWLSVYEGGSSLGNIADFFSTSAEFQNRYGSLTNSQFVVLVYGNVLNRAADPDGFNFWFGQLGSGMSRGTMMVGFSESVEFIKTTGTIP